jgi:hypothetical protein
MTHNDNYQNRTPLYTAAPSPDAARLAITDALTELYNRDAPAGCRPLIWSLSADSTKWQISVSGHAGSGDYNETEAAAVIEAWATHLGLTEQIPTACEGTTQYRGTVNGVEVEVWGVTDAGEFERMSDALLPCTSRTDSDGE